MIIIDMIMGYDNNNNHDVGFWKFPLFSPRITSDIQARPKRIIILAFCPTFTTIPRLNVIYANFG